MRLTSKLLFLAYSWFDLNSFAKANLWFKEMNSDSFEQNLVHHLGRYNLTFFEHGGSRWDHIEVIYGDLLQNCFESLWHNEIFIVVCLLL